MSLIRLSLVLTLGIVLSSSIGCGTNKFQQELRTESDAIKLHNETAKGEYELISTDELKKLLAAKTPIVLVDAMPADSSFNKGHIAGAVNFDFPKEVMDSWSEAMGSRTIEDYAKLLGDEKSKPIIVYCGYVKCARSHNAAVFARELGFTDVKRYPGGIHAWRGAGNQLTVD